MLWVTLQWCLSVALQIVSQIRFLKLREMFEVVDEDGVSKLTMKRTLWVCGQPRPAYIFEQVSSVRPHKNVVFTAISPKHSHPSRTSQELLHLAEALSYWCLLLPP